MKEWNYEKIERCILEIANKFEPARMPTNREVIEMSGSYALPNAIQKNGGYEYWANRLGLEQKASETRAGIKYERIVAKKLRSKEHQVEETSIKYPYDLLVDGCVKVDVKTASYSMVREYKVHSYRISKKQQTCDFYVCCEEDGNQNEYVVPSNACTGQTQIVMGEDSKKYERYKDAYKLIDDAVRFFKSLIA